MEKTGFLKIEKLKRGYGLSLGGIKKENEFYQIGQVGDIELKGGGVKTMEAFVR